MEWKSTWKRVKSTLKKGMECKRIDACKREEQQSRYFREQKQDCQLWLSQNLHPRKTASIMQMLEQMVEAKSWKVARGITEDRRCRVCHEQNETVEYLVAGCKVLANSDNLARHNRAMMILAVTWAKEHELIGPGTV